MAVAGRDMRLFDGRRVQLTDLIEAELLQAGTILEFHRPRANAVHRSEVLAEGRLRIQDGREFAAPSRAAMEAAGLGSIDGWLVWRRPADDATLADLRHELLQNAVGAAEELPDASGDTPSPRSRHELLEAASDSAAADSPERLTVRELLGWWGARVRGYRVVDRILADLDNHRLTTVPDFRKVALDTVVALATISAGPDETDASEELAADASGELDEVDFGLTLGNVPSALAGVVSVGFGDSLAKAMTLMRLHDYSQLPVLPTPRKLAGAVTWRSIAKALAHNSAAELRDAIEPAKDVPYDTELVRVLDDLYDSDFVFVTNATAEISGVVTASDVVQLYGETATPFFMIGEIDHLLRRAISDEWTIDQVAGVCDPEGNRNLASHDDLTMGDYQRMIESPERFAALGWPLDRATFTNGLSRVRDLRNSVTHFDPDPLDSSDVEALEHFLHLLRELRDRSD